MASAKIFRLTEDSKKLFGLREVSGGNDLMLRHREGLFGLSDGK